MTPELADLLIQMSVVLSFMAFNGLIMMTARAIVTSNKSKLVYKSEKGYRGARIALDLAENPLLLLKNVHEIAFYLAVMTGTIAGAALIDEFQRMARRIDFSLIRYNSKDFAILGLIILIPVLSNFLTLFISNQLALQNPEKIAMRFSHLLVIILSIRDHTMNILKLPGKFFQKNRR